MNIFRKVPGADSTGDAIPFFHDGTYHIFSLTPAPGTTVYPARLRTTWSHSISKDLVNWETLETALYPSDNPNDPDADGIWTGDVIFGEGKYHAFYTGYSLKAEFQQTICHATSDDGIHWEKDPANPIIIPIVEKYDKGDWRDPYVFYNDDDDCYWMIFSARRKDQPPTRRGCVILYRSKDLQCWEYWGPLYSPNYTNCPECPEMYKMGDKWYLSYSRFSEFVNTIYRIADSPFGPWRTPRIDGIGGRRFYAAKSMANDEGRRFYFAWAHDRANRSDQGEWYWGGEFCIPHEVSPDDEGNLRVFMPKEMEQIYSKPISWKYKAKDDRSILYGDKSIAIRSAETFSFGFFDVNKDTFLFECDIVPHDCRDNFGILIKSDDMANSAIQLVFDVGMQRVSLLNLPMDVDPFWQQSCTNIYGAKDPGPDGVRVCERTFAFSDNDKISVKVAIDHDLIEVFVGEEVAFTYRSYAETQNQIGLMVQDGSVDFCNIKFDEL